MMPHNNQPQLRPRTEILKYRNTLGQPLEAILVNRGNRSRRAKAKVSKSTSGYRRKNGIITVSSWPKSRFDCHKKGQKQNENKKNKKTENPAVFNTLGTINYMAGQEIEIMTRAPRLVFDYET